MLAMKALLLVATMLAAISASAHAQFNNVQPKQLDDWTALECGILKSTDDDDDDLVYKINVTLKLEHGQLKEMWVKHTTASGAHYTRSDQYQQASIWQTPDKEEWYWRGKRGQNTMVGEVWRDRENKWWYSEKLLRKTRRGRNTKCCHVATLNWKAKLRGHNKEIDIAAVMLLACYEMAYANVALKWPTSVSLI
jgi:hypothetical protein